MKMKFYFIFLFIIGLSCIGCQESDRLMYGDFAGIHFNKKLFDDSVLIVREDTIVYSFAFENPEMKEYVLHIPVEIEGFRCNYERKYQVEIDTEQTTAVAGVHYEALPEFCTLKANAGCDSIALRLFRTDDIRVAGKSLFLRLVPSDDFDLGRHDCLTLKVSFSDILEEPKWWGTAWKTLFGDYHRIKYQEWIKIRGGKGELPEVKPEDAGFLIWYYPLECMQVMELRLYFENNPRYTNEDAGDPNNLGERIVVPCPLG